MTKGFKARAEHKYVGSYRPRVDGLEKASGSAEFFDDIALKSRFPGMLHAKILRSPHPHARIKHIDTSKVEKLKGVESVLTHKDVPQKKLPRRDQRGCLILEDHLRFAGDEVAAVAAVTREIAEAVSYTHLTLPTILLV